MSASETTSPRAGNAEAGGRNRGLRETEVSDLLIALNLCRDLPRAATCRLAEGLRAWAFSPPSRLPAGLAARLRVSDEELAVALALGRSFTRGGAKQAREERRRAADLGAVILTREDAAWPARLLDLAVPPPVLYIQGTLPEGPGVTMVGSRRTDRYGTEVARLFARELAAAGAVVLSGFAMGVDAASHRGALEAPCGRTVAVLGCGLGVDYPRGHGRLGEEISQRGALVTEFPIGTPPDRWQFPVRNRILAALAQAVLVVRAMARSGSLITARQALELGRDIYAIPGNLFDDRSLGPNALIRDGAYLALHPRDILENLDPPLALAAETDGGTRQGEGPPDLTDPATRLLGAMIPAEPLSAEDLAKKLRMPVEQVLAALLELELGGRVDRVPGGLYCRTGVDGLPKGI